MRLDDLDPSSNVEDMGRGSDGFGGGGFGGGGLGGLIGLLPLFLGRRMGCGTIILIGVVLLALSMCSGGMNLTGSTSDGGSAQTVGTTSNGQNVACDTQDEMLACKVLGSTETYWNQYFAANGQRYSPTTLKFYQGNGTSDCGEAQSAMGPFYCPSDQDIYLDTSFYQQLAQMGGDGDFANAYVVAHEVGHHIQKLTGTADKVRQYQARANETQSNAMQVRMELQADCYAGVWAANAKTKSGLPLLESGDAQAGLRAAQSIGDDVLMRQAGRRPVKSMFTHGSAQQRVDALTRGLQSGDPDACNVYFQ